MKWLVTKISSDGCVELCVLRNTMVLYSLKSFSIIKNWYLCVELADAFSFSFVDNLLMIHCIADIKPAFILSFMGYLLKLFISPGITGEDSHYSNHNHP